MYYGNIFVSFFCVPTVAILRILCYNKIDTCGVRDSENS